ncbi:MAG: hypothetical protein ABW278_01920 [Steroidobacteraceae bacterium]
MSSTESAPQGVAAHSHAAHNVAIRSLAVRDVLAAAWPLFQVSLPACLPLALIGVAASGTPGAEAMQSGEGRGFLHSASWWGLYAASTALMLICYGAILRQQLAHAAGRRAPLFESLRQSMLGLLPALAVLLLQLLAFVGGSVLLVLPGLAALVWLFFAWPAQIAGGVGPLAAAARSLQLVRGRFFAVAGVVGATIAAVLVFVLLTGILMAVVMNLAGQGAQSSHGGLSFSRWLMAALLALPVVYVGAVSVAAYCAALTGVPASPAGAAPVPDA